MVTPNSYHIDVFVLSSYIVNGMEWCRNGRIELKLSNIAKIAMFGFTKLSFSFPNIAIAEDKEGVAEGGRVAVTHYCLY